MKDLKTIMKESEWFADQLLNKPNMKRSIFLDGVIHLEVIIDNIILTYFFSYPMNGKIEILDKASNFNKFILNDFGYRDKIGILKKCKIINSEKANKLVAIGEKRNLAAHSLTLKFGPNDDGWISGKEQKEVIKVDDKLVEEFKKNFSQCYAYLMIKLLSLYNPDREDLKIL